MLSGSHAIQVYRRRGVTKLMFLEAFFEWFSRGLPGGVFCGFVLVLRSLRWFFFGQVSGKYSFFPKNAEPRFLHTVQRFGLIFKVWGLPKPGKNSKKGVLEIMVF